MAEPATTRASGPGGASMSGTIDPPTATVHRGASATLQDAPPSATRRTDDGDTPGARPHAPATHRRAQVRGRTLPGLIAGLRLALPGRRGPGSPDGGGRGRRRFPLRPGNGGDGQVDLRNTWQVVAGSLLVPLGVVFILMSWYGAAHTPYVQQQIPYLVSGSFAGVGCMVLGGLLYWAHWLYRIYDQADLHHQEEIDVLRQTLRAIVDRLDDADDRSDAPAVAGNGQRAHGAHLGAHTRATSADAGSDVSAERFVATEGGTYFHVPGCPVVAHHGEGMRPVTPSERSELEPCRICRPTEVAVGQGSETTGPGGGNGR
ncbi:MAG TPA: hypothetical protein VKU86_03810 [Acidimicrobiales bacterium]|nr:hypothetical protein [Acidimicrobiales bacterium]